MGDAPALLSERESFSYSELAGRANQYARWALEQKLEKGDVVCLLMTNRPEYFAIWLGITSVGAVVSLLNTNLVGASLAHSIRIVQPKHVIASSEFASTVKDAMALTVETPAIWIHGEDESEYPRIDSELERFSVEPLNGEERRPPAIDDQALYIYTSGTTGLPKAARVSHMRAMQWSHWFAGMMDVQPMDRMYNCLPMYHSVGGVQVIGAMLAAGGSVVIREKFSASQFWDDVVRWDCTLFEYIGELCRYLLHTEPSANERAHRIRMACGNGLSAEIWDAFKDRFCIPQILEFYAATEGSVSLFNMQGKQGAIGHIPGYLTHRFSPLLVVTTLRPANLFATKLDFVWRAKRTKLARHWERLWTMHRAWGRGSRGIHRRRIRRRKFLRNVKAPGDAWFRTGDLMRRDEKGYYYFVDRIGDTFRRKGENVATSEVAEVICELPGNQHANVYGVAVAGRRGPGGNGGAGDGWASRSGRLAQTSFMAAACLCKAGVSADSE